MLIDTLGRGLSRLIFIAELRKKIGFEVRQSQDQVMSFLCSNLPRLSPWWLPSYHRVFRSSFYSLGCGTVATPCFIYKQQVYERWRKIRGHQSLHTKSVTSASESKPEENKKGLVYVSSSVDTYANLAFEDWVHDHWDLSDLNILLLWRNEPSIVIGRHQNPWTECNIRELQTSNVKLARRRSGGGTVYHDLGNVNCTFFTHRQSYNRKLNLQMVVDGMTDRWPHLDIEINSRDDLMLNQFYKISGTAARLSRTIAYHHFTLLHSANTRILSSLLNRDKGGIKSNATESIKSPVMNLKDAEPGMSQECIIQAIAKQFYSRYQPYYEDRVTAMDDNKAFIFSQRRPAHINSEKQLVYTISPTNERTWKGITQMKHDLMSWEWVYGKTPKFHVQKQQRETSAMVHVNKGLIEGVVLQMPYDWIDIFLIQQLTTDLKGKRFLISDVAITINTFLKDVDVNNETRKRLGTICNLVEDCIS